MSDTRTGLTHAQTRGVMANYGKLRGHTDVKGKGGMSSARKRNFPLHEL